jgi:DNA-binding IclR family transcriptional regulator
VALTDPVENGGHAQSLASDDPGRQGIQSVETAMRVLVALESGGGALSLSAIAQASGMQPSKVHRYLVSLGRVGLTSQDPASGLYDFGASLRRLGAEALRRTNEVAVAGGHAAKLRDRTGHSVNLAVWGDRGPIIVSWAYGTRPLPLTVRVGATLPLLASSVGQVFLAHLPESLTGEVLGEELRSNEGGWTGEHHLRRGARVRGQRSAAARDFRGTPGECRHPRPSGRSDRRAAQRGGRRVARVGVLAVGIVTDRRLRAGVEDRGLLAVMPRRPRLGKRVASG